MRRSFAAPPLHARAHVNEAASTKRPPAATAAKCPATKASSSASSFASSPAVSSSASFDVIYSDPRQKRQGSNDGSVTTDGMSASLFDDEGKLLVTKKLAKGQTLASGDAVSFGKWQAELGDKASPAATAAAACSRAPGQPPAQPGPTSVFKAPTVSSFRQPASAPPPSSSAFKPPTSVANSSCFASASASGGGALGSAAPTAIPAASSAAASSELVLNVGDIGAHPVIVDRQLARKLRPHQAEGVQFLWDCCSGRRSGASGDPLTGCILAHSPGLGKTLQAITLIHTMLRTGPTGGRGSGGGGGGGTPLIKKALIVCPASLCDNWGKEFKKFLPQRLKPALLPSGGGAADAARDFVYCHQPPVLILSYDAVRTHVQQLVQANIGLLVCDEGHRIKASSGNLTIDALKRFARAKRVILTGTPMQNE